MGMYVTGVLDELKIYFDNKKRLSADEKKLAQKIADARKGGHYQGNNRGRIDCDFDQLSDSQLLDLEIEYRYGSVLHDRNAEKLVEILKDYREMASVWMEVEEELDDAKAQIEKLEGQLDDANFQNKDLRAEIENLNEQCAKLEDQLEAAIT